MHNDPWKNIARLPRPELTDLQNRKLHHFVNRYLYPFSPHYRDLFDKNKVDPRAIKTVADLRRIPFSSKKDFITAQAENQIKDFILQPDEEKIRKSWPLPELLKLKAKAVLQGPGAVKAALEDEFRPVFLTFTTGTTSHPVSYFYTKYDIQNLYVSGGRMLSLFNLDPSERIINMFPFAPHLAFWQVVFGGLDAGVLNLSTGGGKAIGTDGNIRALEKLKPAMVLGVPGYVYHVLRAAAEQNIKMPYIRKVILGAAKVTDTYKASLVELLRSMGADNVSVLGTYGFTEARSAWAECPVENNVSSGYHLYPDKEIFEVIDPETGETVGEGEDGELVYSSIDSRGSSVIRFRTGDFVKGGIRYDPCPHCGRTVARISTDIVRLSDIKDMQLTKIKGSLVNFNHFVSILSDFPQIEEWQLEIRKKNDDPFEIDELVIYITTRGKADENALTEQIRKNILTATETSPNEVRYIPLEEMVKRLELETANKEKRILDRRPKE